MTTGFAEMMEGKAREFIDELINEGKLAPGLYCDDSNFKPWYSSRGLIDRGADRVLIGVNPGGCPSNPDKTTMHRKWEKPFDPMRPFNAYLDEVWDANIRRKSQLQPGVRKVFKALYGDQWESELRNTACFNVCPIRTQDSQCIPDAVWNRGVRWTLDVLKELKPSTVLCNGNDDNGTNPWSALMDVCGVEKVSCQKLKSRASRTVKFGIATKELVVTKFVAVPHMSIHGTWGSLHEALCVVRREFGFV